MLEQDAVTDATHVAHAGFLREVMHFAHRVVKMVESPAVIAILPEPERSWVVALSVVDSVATAAVTGTSTDAVAETVPESLPVAAPTTLPAAAAAPQP